MESPRRIVVLLLMIGLTTRFSHGETRYFKKMRTNWTEPLNIRSVESSLAKLADGDDGETAGSVGKAAKRAASNHEKTRSTFRVDDETMIRESLKANHEHRNSFLESSTFDPDVLNKFLDDYANKIKSTTDKNFNFPFRVTKPNAHQKPNGNRDDNPSEIATTPDTNEKQVETNTTATNALNSTPDYTGLNQQDLNDTVKRNKYFGSSTNDDRNGWVTLDAIPWSKSKISKWQASSSSQRPWPDNNKVWEKPNSLKPWEYPSRPAYINNEPWHGTPKPVRPDYQSDRPPMRPQGSNRPSYFDDRFDGNPNQAQKWPPERPQSSWEKFPSADSYRPNIEIITDDRPSNFPNNWDKYSHASTNNKQTYSYNDRDRYTSNDDFPHGHHHQQHQNANNDWRDHANNYPTKFDPYDDKPTNFDRPSSHHYNRPQHMSHYQYTADHPPSHPSNGEGQWVLLSTNRGHAKSRQRSIKIDTTNPDEAVASQTNAMTQEQPTKQENDGTVAVMTSKRQVRLTVLPSINGTNTTTSHGGLLEVERTFKTVDQSQKEDEASRLMAKRPLLMKRRPTRNTLVARPSNSAVLAAVGAGMLPATMAMMIPMMLGRKKRSLKDSPILCDSVENRDFELADHSRRAIEKRLKLRLGRR